MGMYVDRTPVGAKGSRELEQGDVLQGVLLPKLPHERSFGFQRKGSSWFWKPTLTAKELLAEEGKDLRVMSRLDREPYVIVLSNSCDNSSGKEPILLAPVRPFRHFESEAVPLRKILAQAVESLAPRCTNKGCGSIALRVRVTDGTPICDECTQATQEIAAEAAVAAVIREALPYVHDAYRQQRLRDAEEWMAVSRLATAANPKKFYMPADKTREFVRSEAHLVLAQPAEPSYLTRCLQDLGATRVFGLSPEGARHLQYTVSSFVSRNPRDDHAWPSDDDFKLKMVWLEEEIARGGADRDDYIQELADIKNLLGL